MRYPPFIRYEPEYPPPGQPSPCHSLSRSDSFAAARPIFDRNTGPGYAKHIESRNSAKRMTHMADLARSAPREVPNIKLSTHQTEHPVRLDASRFMRGQRPSNALPSIPDGFDPATNTKPSENNRIVLCRSQSVAQSKIHTNIFNSDIEPY